MSDQVITIGTWNESAARELTHCPSYYAALAKVGGAK